VEPVEYLYYQNQRLLFIKAVFQEPHSLLNEDGIFLKQHLHLIVPVNPLHMSVAIYQRREQGELYDSASLKIFERQFEGEDEITALLEDQIKRLSDKARDLAMFQQVSVEPSFILRWRLSSDVEDSRRRTCFALETLFDYISPNIFDKLCSKIK
jgi:hypothetical protein